MKNGCADYSACLGEDRNSDLEYGQRDHSVGILQFVVVVVVEEDQDLEQLQVNCHKEIGHSEI